MTTLSTLQAVSDEQAQAWTQQTMLALLADYLDLFGDDAALRFYLESRCVTDQPAPSTESEESDESDDERLNRFYAELERRQEDGDLITCASCNKAIQPGESADPCFRCGASLCFYCSISGPRCRGCADLP